MAMLKLKALSIGLLISTVSLSNAETRYDIGRMATDAEIAAWNLDIDRNGKSLPAGSGTVQHGREIYKAQCAACHGDKGEGGIGDKLTGGQGTLATPKPVKTVGSFWPYAPTLFDYIRRAMPLNAPQSLSNDEVYAVSAYVLNLNGLVAGDKTIDAKSLASIKMPNRDGFVVDPRPDVPVNSCTKNC